MREIGRGGSSKGKERGAGVTVAAAVAILERQQEEKRRTAPSVRHGLRGDVSRSTELEVSRDSSDSSVSSVGETITRLQNRFGCGVVARNVPSSLVDTELKQNTEAKQVNHATRTKRNEFTSARTKEPENSEVKTNRVVTERERGVNEIRKSPSTKNISSLVRNNPVVSTLHTATLSSDSKTPDGRKYVGDGTPCGLSDYSRSDATQCFVSDSNTSTTEQTCLSELSATRNVRDTDLHGLSSAKHVLDHHDDYDDGDLGAAAVRNETLLHHPQISVEGSTSDRKVPRKRPRVINLRDTGSKDNRPKSNPEVTSGLDRRQEQSAEEEEGPLSNNSSVKIVLEYPPPPPSPPPEYDSCGSTFSSNSCRILASKESLASPTLQNDQRTQASPVQADDDDDDDDGDDDDSGTCSTSSDSGSSTEDVHVVHDDSPFIVSVEKRHLVGVPEEGGNESSPDEEEEDSTLKCSGTVWSGSDSAPRHRSSSTSDFSSSSSSEEAAEDRDCPSHKPCHPTEDLTTTGCDDDFQWVCNSAGVTDGRKRQAIKKSNIATSEKRIVDVCTPESDGSRYNHQEHDYDPPQIMQSQNTMTKSYEKETEKSGVQTSGIDVCEYRQLISASSEASYRKPPRHDSGLKSHASFDKASSLDRRRYHGHNRASRDQKSRSSIVLHSPRFSSPARHASPLGVECPHYSNASCCNEATQIHVNRGVSCYDSAASLLHCSNSHECIHQSLHSSLCNDPAHCCSSTSVREDVMTSSFDSAFSENRRHHHHHHGDIQCCGSAGKLNCRSRVCHGLESQQDLLLQGECCNILPRGDYYGSRGYLPLCSCQTEGQCRRRLMYKQPPVNSDVEERLRRLEADKDSLQLQVTVLTEQIEVQTDKISDLEKLLDEKKKQLSNAEDMLQREMLSRSSLETQKLELLSAMSELKLQQAALERDNLELRDRLGEERRRNKPPVIPRSTLLASSTPVSSQQASQLLGGVSPSPSPVSSLSEGSPRRLGNHPNSVEDFKDIPAPRTPPANYRRKVEHYGSLPRQRITTNGIAISPLDGITPAANTAGMRKGVAFGKGLVSSFLPFQHPHHVASRFKVCGPDKSFSTPNLADAERVVIQDVVASPSAEVVEEEEVDETTDSIGLSPQPSPSFQVGKNKGIKKIFGRMKRSGSGNLDDLPGEGEFRRGGVRATAGPRLGWTNEPPVKQKLDQPFAEWDSDAICRWLQELGLDCYAADAKRWVKSGTQLLQASNHELEKELGIKNPIHRKKLHLALLSQQDSVATLDPYLIPSGELDTAWVLRWLDDAGLPQHKETFLAARVDGRVLHRLTMDELAILHVTSHLHVASLRRGIQVLRDNNFEPNCLKRRSLPDDPQQPTAQDVAQWTNHRVMEWLRVVDLAEYAPNLRGSGVHGGLMVHEPRFTAELLASLLSIPPSKTLLRRHLNTHFKELLGRECIQEKREAEATLGYIPLSATTKVKVMKKSQFALKRKKSKAELDFGDLVCPLDPNKSGETQPPGDGMTRMEAQHPRAVAVSHEASISSPVDQIKSECKFPERTSNV